MAPAAAPGQPVPADWQSRCIERDVQQQGQICVEACLDEPFEQTTRVSPDPAGCARTLQRPHVQQHGRATTTLPGLVHE